MMENAALDKEKKPAEEIDVTHQRECPVCKSEKRTHIGESYDFELDTCSNCWHFYQCSKCSNVYLDPRPAIYELETIYPQHYYAYDIDRRVNNVALAAKTFLDGFKFKRISKRLGYNAQSYLDIGCGSGRYMRHAHKVGVSKEQIHGLDIAKKSLERLAEEGFQTHYSRAEDCTTIMQESIDLITMFHVVEHVEDPVKLLQKLTEWLSPGGLLVFETPNTQSIDFKLFKSGLWGGYHTPRHWNILCPDTIEVLARQAGLKIERLEYETGHSFWMYSMHHWCLKKGWRKLAKVFDPLSSIIPLAFFTGLDKVRGLAGFRTSSVLVYARKLQSK